jgi:NAD(P)-dependent dehydrogenase (short-subunit alcohol dehydrogenase family)
VSKQFSPEDVEACLRVLEAVSERRSHLLDIPEQIRERLLQLAGLVNHPDRLELRQMARARRRRDKHERREHDALIVNATAMRQVRQLPVYVALPAVPGADVPKLAALPAASIDAPVEAHEHGEHAHAPPPGQAVPDLKEPRSCYVCKVEFRKVHFFYDSMCPECAELNYKKRTQSARLDGKVAVITGGRLKIGYQAALLMLRAGATVVVTTRFAHDAALRFAKEPDYADFAPRLRLHGIDLRHSPSVELFAHYLNDTLPRLDLLVHNAAQTVRRPTGFYSHLIESEEAPLSDLPALVRPVLAAHDELQRMLRSGSMALPGGATGGGAADALMTWQGRQVGAGLLSPARLSQAPVTPEDVEAGAEVFPMGRVDQDLQQVDLRRMNSWRMTLADVGTPELLEVHLVNAIAPFILTRSLKPLMMRDRTDEKHVVNVSAMEASFSRKKKTDKHPHTNMAKAALNMLTRTSAADYADDGIWMNSVDTGWVTDEDPLHHVERKQKEHDFFPPLDVVDGAARVCDPFFSGLLTGVHEWGKFFKDYKPTGW